MAAIAPAIETDMLAFWHARRKLMVEFRASLILSSECTDCGASTEISSAARPLPLLCWHKYRSAFVLDEEHHEFRRLGATRVPANNVLVVRTFVKRLSLC